MSGNDLEAAVASVLEGRTVPCLGPGVLASVTHRETGARIPADNEALILGLNDGRPMAPRLMYEFSRAAMHIENKRGRAAVERFLRATYDDSGWTGAILHPWLADASLDYVVDLNRDRILVDAYADRPHVVVLGLARIAGTDYRFKLFEHTESGYVERSPEEIDPTLPVIFKPLGAPAPEPHFIASDADFVDYITELMGGFGIPSFLKKRRLGARYTLVGIRLNRDTERMILADLMYGADTEGGYAVLEDPTPKEEAWCARVGLRIVRATVDDFMTTATRMRAPRAS